MIERDEVIEMIERMKTSRPTCSKCMDVGYDVAGNGYWFMRLMNGTLPEDRCVRTEWVEKYMGDQGFEQMAHRDGWVRRCDECKSTLSFPWADKLDVDKVQEFVNNDPRCEHAFEMRILEETLT